MADALIHCRANTLRSGIGLAAGANFIAISASFDYYQSSENGGMMGRENGAGTATSRFFS